jgi:hypothetical protein
MLTTTYDTAAPSTIADAYWRVIHDCLLQFHGFSEELAQRKIRALQQKAETRPANAIYQAEPFFVACELAGSAIGLSQHREQYTKLLRKHGW